MKGKLLLSLLLVSGLTLGSFNSTYAEDFNTILKTSVDNVKKGDIVPITLELDLTNSMDEVHVYKGTLEYDKNIIDFFINNVVKQQSQGRSRYKAPDCVGNCLCGDHFGNLPHAHAHGPHGAVLFQPC